MLSNELLKLIAAETGKEATLETRLDDLGIDSLEFVALIQTVSETFKEIPDAEFAKLETVNDILKAIS